MADACSLPSGVPKSRATPARRHTVGHPRIGPDSLRARTGRDQEASGPSCRRDTPPSVGCGHGRGHVPPPWVWPIIVPVIEALSHFRGAWCLGERPARWRPDHHLPADVSR